MAILTIDLQEGFSADTVAIRARGHEVYRRAGVTTNPAISLADSVPIDLPEGEIELEIDVPTRDLTRGVSLNLTGQLWLIVSIVDHMLETTVSSERPYYM
jgi:hypothetical protein